MSLFVDTSVWSLALRRDAVPSAVEVMALRQALEADDTIVTTGLVLQELLQGFAGPRARREIIAKFAALPFINPDRQDHIEAADLRNRRPINLVELCAGQKTSRQIRIRNIRPGKRDGIRCPRCDQVISALLGHLNVSDS